MFIYKTKIEIPPHILEPYQEQDHNQTCIFECRDGRQSASKWILQLSKFFSKKIKGFDQHQNEMKFDYTDYRTQTVKTYLDMLHGIDQDDLKFHILLELLKFLRYEGKATVVKGKPISSLDFKLYKDLHEKLEKTSLTVTDAILACLFLSQVDSYDEALFEVLKIFRFFVVTFIKTLIEKYEEREIIDAGRQLDMFSDKNKPVIELIVSEAVTDDNMEQIELDIATELVLFERKIIKLLKRNRDILTKAPVLPVTHELVEQLLLLL